jgi:CubicO group peptidase (beta-lactamase class C family)
MLNRRELLIGPLQAFLATSRLRQNLEGVLSGLQTTSMVVLKRGERIFEYGDVKQTSYLASARKSLVSMLYGPSVARGTLQLNKTLADLGIDDMGGLLPIERQATIRDLLMARSGVYHPAANLGDASDRAPARGSVKPGAYFLYNNWDFNALGAIFERVTGRKLYRAFYEDIGEPIGFEDWHEDQQAIRNDTQKSLFPAHHFVLSTRDMARVGALMLNRGKWRGRQVLPASWVRRTTEIGTPAAEVQRTSPFVKGLGYGYLWWVFDPAAGWDKPLSGAYTASGAYGQFITVIPQRQMVIAHKTAVPPPRNVSADDYIGRVLPAVASG